MTLNIDFELGMTLEVLIKYTFKVIFGRKIFRSFQIRNRNVNSYVKNQVDLQITLKFKVNVKLKVTI